MRDPRNSKDEQTPTISPHVLIPACVLAFILALELLSKYLFALRAVSEEDVWRPALFMWTLAIAVAATVADRLPVWSILVASPISCHSLLRGRRLAYAIAAMPLLVAAITLFVLPAARRGQVHLLNELERERSHSEGIEACTPQDAFDKWALAWYGHELVGALWTGQDPSGDRAEPRELLMARALLRGVVARSSQLILPFLGFIVGRRMLWRWWASVAAGITVYPLSLAMTRSYAATSQPAEGLGWALIGIAVAPYIAVMLIGILAAQLRLAKRAPEVVDS